MKETLSAISDKEKLDLLTFTVGNQEYGIPVTRVVRIIEMVKIIKINGVSKFVQGIINYQGKAVPVMDMRLRLDFDHKDYGLHTPIVLVDLEENHLLGLIVDEVKQVINISADTISQTTAALPHELNRMLSEEANHLQGIANVDRKMIITLELATLLSKRDMKVLSASIEDFDNTVSEEEKE